MKQLVSVISKLENRKSINKVSTVKGVSTPWVNWNWTLIDIASCCYFLKSALQTVLNSFCVLDTFFNTFKENSCSDLPNITR